MTAHLPTHRTSLTAAALILALLIPGSLAQPNVSNDKFIIFIGMGHSNMEGRSKQKDTQTHPRCWNYRNGSWQPAKEPIQSTRGGGPAMPFLKKMAALYPGYHFGWMGTAASSLMIRDYHKGKSRFNLAASYASKAKKVGTLGGVLTMLGMQEARESKSSESQARAVCEDFKKLIDGFRAEVGIGDLPFLLGRYEENSPRAKAGGADARWKNIVIREIREVPSKVSRTAVIESDGPYDDDHHFSYEGHKRWSQKGAGIINNKNWMPDGSSSGGDTQAPSAPTNLTATGTTTTTISLSWNASSDDIGVSSYTVYRNGTKEGTTSNTSYKVSSLSPGTTYRFAVKAHDAAGNTSSASPALEATTEKSNDTQAPTAPTSLKVTTITTTSIALTWSAASDNVAVTDYHVFKNGTKAAATGGTTSYTVTGLSPNTEYTFAVAALDAAGNSSSKSTTITATTSEPATAGAFPLKINAGGSETSGYFADQAWTDGAVYGHTGSSNATWWGRVHNGEWKATSGTDDDSVFAYVRHGASFGYNVSVPKGYYAVTLQFAEYWRSGAGQRVFKVLINDNEIADSPVDIYGSVGAEAALEIQETVVALYGSLTIDFQSVTDNGMVSGIVVDEVVPYVITSPAKDETYAVGQQMMITWSSPEVIQDVVIDITCDDGKSWHPIVANELHRGDAQWGTYAFEIPLAVDGQELSGKTCRIKLRDYDDLASVESANFAVAPPGATLAGRMALPTGVCLKGAARGPAVALTLPRAHDYTVTIVNGRGQTAARRIVEGPGAASINTADLAGGAYLLRVDGPGVSYRRTFVKQ